MVNGRIALLVVDVEIDYVGGNFLFAKEAHDFTGAGFGVVAVAALLVAEAPERGERRAADQRGVFRDDFLRIGTGEEIIVQLATFGAEGKIVGRFLAEIEAAAVGIVEKKAVGGAFAEADEKWNGFVERVGGFAPAEGVGVPIQEGVVAVIHGPRFVSQAVIIFVGGIFFQMRMRGPFQAIGRVGSSARMTRPCASAKEMSRGDL